MFFIGPSTIIKNLEIKENTCFVKCETWNYKIHCRRCSCTSNCLFIRNIEEGIQNKSEPAVIKSLREATRKKRAAITLKKKFDSSITTVSEMNDLRFSFLSKICYFVESVLSWRNLDTVEHWTVIIYRLIQILTWKFERHTR